MAPSPTDPGRSGWHRALTYAITGVRTDDWTDDWTDDVPGRSTDPDRAGPDLPALAAYLIERAGGSDRLLAGIDDRRRSGQPWPYPVPDDLRAGLGAAQFFAALTELRSILGVDRSPIRPVISDRAPDADERRLLGEVPPHHGS